MTKQEAEQLMAESQYLIGKQIPLKDFDKNTGKNLDVIYSIKKFVLSCMSENKQKESCSVTAVLQRNESKKISTSLKTIVAQFPPSYFEQLSPKQLPYLNKINLFIRAIFPNCYFSFAYSYRFSNCFVRFCRSIIIHTAS